MTSRLYEYTKLEPGQIRLLRLRQGSSTADSKSIDCEITRHALSACPSYTAVSYCWGTNDDAQSCLSLLVDGCTMPVRENLFNFLVERMRRYPPQNEGSAAGTTNPSINMDGHDPDQPYGNGDGGGRRYNLRRRRNQPHANGGDEMVSYSNNDNNSNSNNHYNHSSSGRRAGTSSCENSGQSLLWVDAICINQADDAEKNMQLPMMGDIYASAARIVIWLGSGDENSETALRCWERLAQHHRLQNNEEEGGGTRKCAIEVPSQGECTALTFLSRRGYWRRVWVLQEASTPEVSREIWCGESCVQFDDAVIGNEAARQYVLSLGKIPSTNPWIPELENLAATERLRFGRRHRTLLPPGPRLLDLLYRSRDLEATNPKDKVYALLPIYEDVRSRRGKTPAATSMSPRLVVDYTSKVERTFRQAATHILAVERDPRILLLCSRSNALASLHSWVPNFVKIPAFFSIFDCIDKFKASGNMAGTPALAVDPSGKVLQFRGTQFDTVRQVHPPLAAEGSAEQSATSAEYWQGPFDAWMRSVTAFLFKGGEKAYFGGGSLSEAVDRVLTLDCSPGLVMERATYSESSGWSVAHWPFREIQAGTMAPPSLGDDTVLPLFTDMLLRTGHGSLFWTKSGRIGLGDPGVRAGDVLVICHGLSVPVILRRISSWGDVSWCPPTC